MIDAWYLLAYLAHYLCRPKNYDTLCMPAQTAMNLFCEAYETAFEKTTVTYNVHLFKHSIEVHDKFGSLCKVSAYGSEDMYQQLLKCYESGTASVCKQAINNLLLKYSTRDHRCKYQSKFRQKETYRTQDNYVFTVEYEMFKVLNAVEELPTLDCVKMNGLEYHHRLQSGDMLNLSDIGVFRGPCTVTNEHVEISKQDVLGKVVVAPSYAVCVPFELLYERSY